jgi:hypothetical protein
MIPQLIWTDHLGRKYVYSVFGFEQEWVDFPGNYIIARRSIRGFEPLYIGEAESLKRRLGRRHEAWSYCHSRGATHVLVHFNFAGPKARQEEEQGLILAYDPPGNNPESSGTYVRLPDFRKSA